MSTAEARPKAIASLERIQQFDAKSLARVDDLGKQLNFNEIVGAAQEIIDVYKRLPIAALEDFAEPQLSQIQSQADSDFQLFQQILDFDATAPNATTVRGHLIGAFEVRRDGVFQALWQFIAYGVARSTDTSLLDVQARGVLQSIRDEAKVLTGQLADDKAAADTALKAIRDVAAEQGVSQQAIYYKSEAETQETNAGKWLKLTYLFAAILAGCAVASLFLHRWEWLAPQGQIEALQFISSKVLVFALLAYMLVLAARNYNAHKHNAVVNRHRQNALLTYKALVEAATERGTQDIVLAHAAACIFSPQETGYAGGKSESAAGSKSVLELLTKSSPKTGD